MIAKTKDHLFRHEGLNELLEKDKVHTVAIIAKTTHLPTVLTFEELSLR